MIAVIGGRMAALEAPTDPDAILERARAGTRLMTMRGAAMRSISVGANLLLLLLVSPSELGLLAVARGTFALVQYVAELGIGKALLRRQEPPTPAEYAALAGLQLIVGVIVVAISALWSAPILGFGAINERWHVAMLLTVSTMTSLAWGTGARVRLDRALAYERLAVVDVLNVLILNVGLVAFALAHQFTIGVFVLLGVATVSANALLHYWAPGPRPSLNLRPLVGVARESSGFLIASTSAVLREQGTPVLIGGLFGLPVAGLYSFAERVAQVLNVSFDGFRNACIPAAARLNGDARSLRALASRTLLGSATLTAPLAVIAICAIPVLAHAVPKWSAAVTLMQWYVVAYATYGVLAASMEPVAVATRGATAAITEQMSALVAGWLAFVAVRSWGSAYLPIAVVIMYITPLLALRVVTSAEVRPEFSRDVVRIGVATASSLLMYVVLRFAAASLLVSAMVPIAIIFVSIPRLRSLPSQLTERCAVFLASRNPRATPP